MSSLLAPALVCPRCNLPRAIILVEIKGYYKSGKRVKDTRYIRMIVRCPRHGGKSITVPYHVWAEIVPLVTEHILLCTKCVSPATPLRFRMKPKISVIEIYCPEHRLNRRKISTELAGDVWQHASESTPPVVKAAPAASVPSPTASYCRQCGAPISPADAFCGQCGASID
ncbi:MAG: zinc ribbon domain-containing protein [Promethearchaeota archaeon]